MHQCIWRTNMAHSTLVHAGGRTMHGRDPCAAILYSRGSRAKAARQLHEGAPWNRPPRSACLGRRAA